ILRVMDPSFHIQNKHHLLHFWFSAVVHGSLISISHYDCSICTLHLTLQLALLHGFIGSRGLTSGIGRRFFRC
ncbi:hypothetical protein PENTCL1PPCAC_29277, partial [Pristionchus entomophagus]